MAELIVQKQAIADKALDDKVEPVVTSPVATKSAVTIQQPKTVTQTTHIPQEKVEAAHQCLKILAGVCNGAKSWDGAGFGKTDTDFGHSLANRSFLTQGQALYAVKLANKYRAQLPADLKEILGITTK